MGFPAASQELDQMALSLSKVTYSLEPDNSLSNGEAVTVMLVLFAKRLAVSLTTAKASGKISFKTPSVMV